MNDKFELLDAFKSKKIVAELQLCLVLMENKEFPWILLIPRRPGFRQMNQLILEDRVQLMEEITTCSFIMEKLFPTDVLNVAAIGNKTPQLHVHIISRNQNDSLWPGTVWGMEMKKLSAEEEQARAELIKTAFASAASA
ncbi:MAG: HIT family protein [Holosporaceae bacterium]|jgi:diadenosine tetraphosphate (Ap4A) HIT family hydrolase|nr:HIT family protein [Holosporaceae bacterium]